ncbi:MAG: ammonium transporter [Candidatus Gastranaerophilaceae bacterium]|jgi:Amt family ammonium transporter
MKWSKFSKILCVLTLVLLFGKTDAVFAAATNTINPADTVWMLVSTALVMLMTPGLALFYGGMVRKKNTLGTIVQSFTALGVVTIVWVLWGYSLSFSPDFGGHGLIGGLSWVGLKGVGLEPSAYAPTIPHQLFMLFQMMFAIITPALITGAIAERMKFKSYLIFLVLWITFVYSPIAHWVWGGGWIAKKLGALDFAGGLVVHISSGVSALAACLLIGKRKGYGNVPLPPYNLTMTLLGAGVLWFGWFGFNAGSALAANGLAVSAFATTQIATAVAAFSWMIIEWAHRKKPTALGIASGAVAGLVAITPAAGFVQPLPAMIIGFMAGIICYVFVSIIKPKLGYDDSLDAFGVHGIGGMWGALATGLFATKLINPAGANGFFYGNPSLLIGQFISIVVTVVYAFVVSSILLKLIDMVIGLRITADEELQGLDLSQHGEKI